MRGKGHRKKDKRQEPIEERRKIPYKRDHKIRFRRIDESGKRKSSRKSNSEAEERKSTFRRSVNISRRVQTSSMNS